MGPELLYHASVGKGTPLGAAGRGIAGGLAGALLLSVVSRVLPGLRVRRTGVPLGRQRTQRCQPSLRRSRLRSPLDQKV